MDNIQVFLADLEKLSQPRDKLARLMACPDGEDDRVKAAIAWWHARYDFTNKKKTATADKFIWFLLCLSTGSGKSNSSAKQIAKAYDNAFMSPAIDAAMALEDRLSHEILDACTLYIRTITPHTTIMGLIIAKNPDHQTTLTRIAGTALGMIARTRDLCGEKPHAKLVTEGLYRGAIAAYPDIEPVLREINGNKGR